MNIRLLLVSVAILAGSGAMAANGQCYDPSQGEYFRVPCANANAHCRFTVGIYYAEGAGDTAYITQSVSCCGINMTLDVPYGTCQSLHIKSRQTKETLLALAQSERILIPTCSGSYRPAQEVLADVPKQLYLRPRPIVMNGLGGQ